MIFIVHSELEVGFDKRAFHILSNERSTKHSFSFQSNFLKSRIDELNIYIDIQRQMQINELIFFIHH